ncbi:MAG: hypothetical protein RMA76_14430 [Deltaproteobacteria bacterium]
MKRAEFAFSPPGRMLFRFAIDEAAMQARFGPPHYGANGPRGLPAWGFELEDGTSFELHFRAGDDTCYVNGDLRDIDYLVARLALADVVDRLDEDPTHYAIALEEHFPAWQMHRLVVDGAVVHETPSPREAAWRADQTGARIELEPEADARARRERIVSARGARPKRPPAPVRAVSTEGTWEVWRVAADGGRSLVGVFEEREKAEAHAASLDDAQIVPRAP